ncbi:MAG: hypothetical protein WBA12_00630, partial [Catalinimonas sp.]
TEGAAPVATDTALVLYYDSYSEKGYKYVSTRDYQTWSAEQAPVMVDSDNIMRHGSVVEITRERLQGILEAAGNP